nr:MAG TPA: TFIIB Transcription factor zinc-finger [Caudoviricetes sp.]
MIGATSRPPRRTDRSIAVCARCGVERRSGGNTTPLCRDCKGVLSASERVRWAA